MTDRERLDVLLPDPDPDDQEQPIVSRERLERIYKVIIDLQRIQKRLKLPNLGAQPIEQAVKTALKTAENCLWQYMKHVVKEYKP